MFIVLLVLVPPVIFYYKQVNKQAEQCSLRGGVMLKTLDGWSCLDIKVLT